MSSLVLSSVTSAYGQYSPKQKRHGKIFLFDSWQKHSHTTTPISASVSGVHLTPIADERRYGQIFPNHFQQDTNKNERVEPRLSEQVKVTWYTIPEINQKRYGKRKIADRTGLDAPVLRDELEKARCRLRSIKSFDDMLIRGFLINEELNEYELTVYFSLTPQIARDH